MQTKNRPTNKIVVVKQQKKKQLSRKWRDDLLRGAPNAYLALPRTVDQCFPDRFITRLSYNGFGTQTIAAGAQTKSYRYQPTAAYDIDPAIGSTTTVGFSEFAAIYNNYRVFFSKLIVKAANTTSTPVQLVIIPLNADPGSSPSTVTIQEWTNNPYHKIGVVPAAGSPPLTLARSMSTEKIYGSKMIYFDDNFASLVNTIPVNNWYWAIGLLYPLPGSAASNLSVAIEIDIEIDVEFYGRKNLLN